jgi:hypothetical protein
MTTSLSLWPLLLDLLPCFLLLSGLWDVLCFISPPTPPSTLVLHLLTCALYTTTIVGWSSVAMGTYRRHRQLPIHWCLSPVPHKYTCYSSLSWARPKECWQNHLDLSEGISLRPHWNKMILRPHLLLWCTAEAIPVVLWHGVPWGSRACSWACSSKSTTIREVSCASPRGGVQ